jgi:large repetitive protein
MGDIRIGGYAFGNSVLGMTYYPPAANNYSIAGDVALNTGQPFNIGSTYDLFTVAAHEIGHALGLGESSVTNSIEYANYNGVKNALASDDVAGIRNLYSSNAARTPDAFASAPTPNNSFASAANLNSYISSTSLTAALPKLDMTTTSQVEYFSFTAPAKTTGTLAVNVQSSGLSLLAPKVTVYAADQSTVLGSATALGQFTGARLTINVANVMAGQQFYVKVQGTDTTAFSTGAYALTLNFGSGPSPTIAPPSTLTTNGSPLQGGGGYAQNSADAVYLDSVPAITGISPDTGASNSDGVTTARNLVFSGVAPVLSLVKLYEVGPGGSQLIGSVLALVNNWSISYSSHSFSAGSYTFYATASGLLGLGPASAASTTYTVTVDTVAPAAPAMAGFTPDPANNNYTNSSTPTLSGTAEANSMVTVFQNGAAIGTTAADSAGNWSYTVKALSDNTYTFTTTATDLAGNVSAVSAPLTLTVDTQAEPAPAPAAPQLTSASILSEDAYGNIQAIATPTFVGTAAAGTIVTIVDGTTVLGTAVVNSSGAWSFTAPMLGKGKHSIAVFDIDAQGNDGLLSSAVSFQV